MIEATIMIGTISKRGVFEMRHVQRAFDGGYYTDSNRWIRKFI